MDLLVQSNIIHDVVHGDIILDDLAKKIINTKEFKRLMGITQTGSAKYVIEGLKEENRYYHSIGAYYIMTLMIENFERSLQPYGISISSYHKRLATTAMLLHDIGHGSLSHTMEKIIDYPHENSTVDIIKDKDTEIHKVLAKVFSDDEIDSLISFINYESNDEIHIKGKRRGNIIDILKLLVSNQIDADRLDYLMRDAHFAGSKSAIDLDKIINGFRITIDNARWILVGDQDSLSQYETVLFERRRNYRDIYYHPISLLIDNIIRHSMELISQDEKILASTSNEVKDMLKMKGKMPLQSFLKLNDATIEDLLLEISKNHANQLIGYACNIQRNVRDYILINPEKNIEIISRRLRMIFKDIPNIDNFDFLKGCILVDKDIILNIYKSNDREGIYIDFNGNILDIEQCSNIINRKPDHLKVRFINLELLRLYFNIDEITFNQKYLPQLKSLIEWINYPEKEFELKYVQSNNQTIDSTTMIKLLQDHGFTVVEERDVLNTDFYYDNDNLDLFKCKKTMRIREITHSNNDKPNYELTYKAPIESQAIFSTRIEITDVLENNDINEAKNKLLSRGVNTDSILPFHILKIINHRHVIELEKNGVRVELSFDDVNYENNITDGKSSEQMVEIELKLGSKLTDRIILDEIYGILDNSVPELTLDNYPNKYSMGLIKTDTPEKADEIMQLIKRKEKDI